MMIGRDVGYNVVFDVEQLMMGENQPTMSIEVYYYIVSHRESWQIYWMSRILFGAECMIMLSYRSNVWAGPGIR